jgi:hypothetical protein
MLHQKQKTNQFFLHDVKERGRLIDKSVDYITVKSDLLDHDAFPKAKSIKPDISTLYKCEID